MSLRHRTDDHLWFTFFHEAAHLLLHSRKSIFLEAGDSAVEAVREAEADRWARDFLVPKGSWDTFVGEGAYTSAAITALADALSIAPGIVVGRLQHEGRIAFGSQNSLERKLEIDALKSLIGRNSGQDFPHQ